MSQVGGGLPQDLARENGKVVVNRAGEKTAKNASVGDVLFLDAGIDFDIFVEEPF